MKNRTKPIIVSRCYETWPWEWQSTSKQKVMVQQLPRIIHILVTSHKLIKTTENKNSNQ